MIHEHGMPFTYLLMKVLVVQLCLTLCNPMDSSLPGSSVHGMLQARILEWVANSFSRGSSRPRDWTQVSGIAGRFFTVWATREAWSSLFFSINVLLLSSYTFCISFVKFMPRDFPGGLEVRGLPSSEGDAGLIPGLRTRIPHAAGQLSLPAAVKTQHSKKKKKDTFLPKYFTLFGAFVHGVTVLISFLSFSLQVSKNTIDFCPLIFLPSNPAEFVISSNRFL